MALGSGSENDVQATDAQGAATQFTSRIPRPSSFGVRIDNTADSPRKENTMETSKAKILGTRRPRENVAVDERQSTIPSNKRKQAAVNTTRPAPVKKSNTNELERETWDKICEREGLNVDSLLAIRISGKNKFDFKGRCEQQMTYIKQMRACIRHLRDSEATAAVAMKDLEKNLEEKSAADRTKKNVLAQREKELLNEIDVLNASCENLESTISKVKADSEKQIANEIEARQAVEAELKDLKDKLKEKVSELKQLQAEKERLINESAAQANQLATLQEMHAKSNEYAKSLQEYNAKLQSEAAMTAEAMTKSADDRVSLQTDMANLRGAHEALQAQLSAATASVKENEDKYRIAEEEREKLRIALDESSAERTSIRESLEAEKSALNSELVTLRGTHDSVVEQLRVSRATCEEAETNRQKLSNDLTKVRSENESLQTEKGNLKLKLEGEKAELQTEIASLEGRLESQRGQIKSVADSLEESETNRQKLAEDLSRARSEIDNIQSEKGEMKLKLEGEKAEMQTEIAALKGAQEALQSQVKTSADTLEQSQHARQMAMEDIARLRGELETIRRERENLKSDLAVAHEEINEHKEGKEKYFADLDTAKNTTESLESHCRTQEQTIASLKRDLDTVSRRLKLAEDCSGQRLHEFDELSVEFSNCKDELAELKRKFEDGEMVRRKLHNTIQELKGNIRVFCRVRPQSHEEQSIDDDGYLLKYPEGAEVAGRAIELQHGEKGPQYNFNFDKVFQPSESQDKVFEEISMLVQSALDGYKVCIFAYGQTGSGKTYTMLGDDESPGMIPLSLEQIFNSSSKMAEHGWDFTMHASMLEIHNEEIKDLLGKGKTEPKTHTIKHDAAGTIVNGLTVVEVGNKNEVAKLLKQSSKARSVGKTDMNERSSRSHMVFTLRLDGSNSRTGQTVGGVLNLIDLAGSERLSRSGATGERLKETQSINKSLSALGDVILSLHNRDSHIPYRNSKLTYLLQPCLGGESKTLMFVNVSPTRDSANETLCSLRFAAKVNACEVGTARKQTRKGGGHSA